MADIKNITIDGTTYDLKDAKAREDVSDLKEDLRTTRNGKKTITQADIVQGSYGSANPYIIAPSDTRIRTARPVHVFDGDKVTVEIGTNCAYFAIGFYTPAGTWIREQNWTGSNTTVNITSEMLLLFAFHNADNTNITPTNFDANVNIITESQLEINSINETISENKIFNVLKSSIKPIETFFDVGWYYGYINNIGEITQENRNICNPQFIYIKQGTVITPSDGYRFCVALYNKPDTSGYYDRYNFRYSALTIPNECYIRISIANGTPATEITDIPTALSKFTISSNSGYILNPVIFSNIAQAEPYLDAVSRFVTAMNKKAQQIGMTRSLFADPAGYDTTINITTARDLVRLGIEACAYNQMCRVWNTDSYTITTLDKNHREIVCTYTDDISELSNAYTVLGKKAGYMPLSGGGSTYTMLAVCVVDDNVVVGAIGGASSRENRPKAMKELMDNVKRIIDGGSAVTPTYYQYGCAALLPKGNPCSYEQKTIPFIYELLADTQFVPASTVKTLTVLTALDYITDIHSKMTVLTSDGLNYGSGKLIENGDILNFEQAIYLIMLPSSGPTSRVLARTTGEKMILEYD